MKNKKLAMKPYDTVHHTLGVLLHHLWEIRSPNLLCLKSSLLLLKLNRNVSIVTNFNVFNV